MIEFLLAMAIDPLVSVGAAQRSPVAPVVVPAGDCDCGCGGTGILGDGTIEMPCGCDASCECKKGTRSPVEAAPVCVDGSCGKPAKSAPVARRGLFGRWR